jgi:hypothetical protein
MANVLKVIMQYGIVALLERGRSQRSISRKHRDELLAFARTPGVEHHNNRAEREVRPTVVNRKNSRTHRGKH